MYVSSNRVCPSWSNFQNKEWSNEQCLFYCMATYLFYVATFFYDFPSKHEQFVCIIDFSKNMIIFLTVKNATYLECSCVSSSMLSNNYITTIWMFSLKFLLRYYFIFIFWFHDNKLSTYVLVVSGCIMLCHYCWKIYTNFTWNIIWARI